MPSPTIIAVPRSMNSANTKPLWRISTGPSSWTQILPSLQHSGRAKHELGQYEAALADLDRAIELDRTYDLAYNSRGARRQPSAV